MLKTFVTLVRGAAARAEEEVVDRSALLLLDQQMRDAAGAIERGKRALALAIAQDEGEGRRLDLILVQLADLEERATAALAGGREDLAREAAATIAELEADRDALREARAAFAAESAQLRAGVAQSARRLAELERGRRIAQAAEAVRRIKTGPAAVGTAGAASLAEAEATLRRLRERQAEEQAAATALRALDAGAAPAGVAGRLEAAGFGRRTRPTAADVLERLRQRAVVAAAS